MKSFPFELHCFQLVLFGLLLMISNCSLAQKPNDSGSTSILIKDAIVKLAKSVEIPVEQPGVLAKLLVREGDRVEEDGLIGRLKDAELRIRLDRAILQKEIATTTAASNVDIEYAKKSYDVAAAEVSRSEQANGRVAHSIPLTRLEKQRLEKERTRLQLQQAERESQISQLQSRLAGNDVRLAESQLQQTEIRSPVAGIVVTVNSTAGEWVQPGQTVAKVITIDRLRMEGFVSAEQARSIGVGDSAQIKFAQDWLQRAVKGTVIFVSPEANPINLNVAIWIEIENADGKIIPGLKGDIEIVR